MKFNKSSQSGFTLVEIAIVLVIIGLLLGGVLKGQSMIDNARMKGIVTDINGVSSAYNSYFDRYQAVPGDEAAATVAARGWLTGVGGAIPGGNGDGLLTVTPAQTFANGGEEPQMWEVLIAAGFTTGPAVGGVVGLPKNAVGGYLGVSYQPFAFPGVGICVSALSTRQAAGVDVIIDGALPANNIGNNVGSFQGITGAGTAVPTAAAPGALAYNEVTTVTPWSMCRTL